MQAQLERKVSIWFAFRHPLPLGIETRPPLYAPSREAYSSSHHHHHQHRPPPNPHRQLSPILNCREKKRRRVDEPWTRGSDADSASEVGSARGPFRDGEKWRKVRSFLFDVNCKLVCGTLIWAIGCGYSLLPDQMIHRSPSVQAPRPDARPLPKVMQRQSMMYGGQTSKR